ncbi:MAG: xylose isomerase [Flavobacteriaceae bacterium]|nr:xylose isomerase [Flavobacteriaceae bacterium]
MFFQTNWGYNGGIEDFIEKAKKSGYDGVEIWLPAEPEKQNIISKALKKFDMKVIFLCGTNRNLKFEESLIEYKNYLKKAIDQKPLAINSHTGSDFLTYDQNMAFIDAANNLSKASNIPIYHETHRGRFSYSLPETIKYLEKNDNLFLTLDISHWMVVHESLLKNQDKFINSVINRSNHIHARVGFEEGPQVNDVKAPEWKSIVDRHLEIWEFIIRKRWDEGKMITVTTEFGPPNYMPTEPVTKKPLSDQWNSNTFIMKSIKDRIKQINLN